MFKMSLFDVTLPTPDSRYFRLQWNPLNVANRLLSLYFDGPTDVTTSGLDCNVASAYAAEGKGSQKLIPRIIGSSVPMHSIHKHSSTL